MSPAHDVWRTDEYALIASGFLRDLWSADNVAITSTRDLQVRWLAHLEKRRGRLGPIALGSLHGIGG